MNTFDLKNIISGGENILVEFKQAKRELNKDVYESVCAMLNRNGGHLILGVADNGTITGVDKDCVEKIKKNYVTSMHNPDKICPTIYTYLEEYIIDDKIVLYAFIPQSADVHRVSGRIYDRNEDGDLDITNNTNSVAQLYNRKTSQFTELKIYPYANIDNLDKEVIYKIRKMAHNRANGTHIWESMNDLELLKSANLYRKDQLTGEEGLTLAGILLLGTQEMIFSALPQYKTDAIVRIKNIDRYDDREIILDNLVNSYYKLMNFVAKHLDDKFYLEGSQNINVRNKIFREVCANLLIHREFSSAFPAKLIIEKDFVRTENANKPNGFGVINTDNFSPYPKNPAISKFFREIGLADELGSGIKNVTRYLKQYSGGVPEFVEGDVFRLNLPLTPQVAPQVTPQVTPQVAKRIDEIIKFCSTPKSAQEIMTHLELSDRKNFFKKYINPLLQNGVLIMTSADKPNSRLQKYVILNKK